MSGPTPPGLTAEREQQIRYRSREIHEQYHGAADVAYESCSACETDRLVFAALDSARAAHDALAAERDRLAAAVTAWKERCAAARSRALEEAEAREAAEAKAAALAGALREWKCPVCHGERWIEARTENDDEHRLPCKRCEQTGLHPTARARLAEPADAAGGRPRAGRRTGVGMGKRAGMRGETGGRKREAACTSETCVELYEAAWAARSALDALLGDSDLDGDESPAFRACQRLSAVLNRIDDERER